MKDYRCECGHAMGQHDENGCAVGWVKDGEAKKCGCEVRSIKEPGDDPVRQVAAAAKEQMEAFIAEGFSREEALALTKELLLVTARGA